MVYSLLMARKELIFAILSWAGKVDGGRLVIIYLLQNVSSWPLKKVLALTN